MKTENKLTLLFFFGLLAGLIFVCHIIPTKSESDETDFVERLSDTTLINHSEIQVQELSDDFYKQYKIYQDSCTIYLHLQEMSLIKGFGSIGNYKDAHKYYNLVIEYSDKFKKSAKKGNAFLDEYNFVERYNVEPHFLNND